jgi:hypothetical protein
MSHAKEMFSQHTLLSNWDADNQNNLQTKFQKPLTPVETVRTLRKPYTQTLY